MNPYLTRIQELLNDKPGLSQEEKDALLKALKEADKQWTITDFKLDRTEKVKKTAAILLEETIAELELKRKAVEDQNRELEVEGALERVRTIAMAMQSPEDMLKICRSITQELHHLGLKEIRNVQTVIINVEKGTYLNYEYFDRTDKEVITSVVYNEHEVVRAFVQKVLSDPEAFFSTVLEGEDLGSWIAYQRSSGQFVDPFSEQASSIHYYFYSIGEGALGISTYAPLQDTQIELFNRFRNVFALAYKRFTDIETAQAQAREAQIEAALERVRAQTMAMHSSTDLAKVSSAMFEQMKQLGGDLFAFGIVLCDKHENMVEQWHGLPTGKGMMNPFLVPIDLDHIHRYRYDQWKAGTELFSIEIPSDYIARHFELMLSVPSVGSEINRMVAEGYDFRVPEWEIDYGASFKHGYLLVSSLKPFREDKIFPRFARVFDQAYTRFLDLQKAEVQAREAQIEAALEKVRSRSLAMQKPEEIKQVAELLRSEMAALGVEELETSSIYIPRDDQGLYECWYAIKDVRGSNAPLISDEMTLDLRDTWVGREMLQFAGSAEEKTSVLMKGEQRIEWINYCSQRSKVLEGYYGDEIPERTYHLFKFAYGYLGAASPGNISAESWSLLKRAAAVFSFAYTRFLDLQDAAARAREAQIQLGLERVRSRSMAMHRSGELVEVARTLFDQMAALGFVIDGALILLFNREERSMQLWIATTQLPEPVRVQLPYDETIQDNQVMKDIWQSFESGTHLYNKAYSGDTKNNYFRYVSQHNPFNKEVETFQLDAESWVLHLATTPHALLGIDSWQGRMITEQEFDTIIRFSQVFEQAYIRFLDLQKAEAQAREAQIEAALERVRSRTMAMQKSDELPEAALLLFNQLQQLGMPAWSAGYCTWNDEQKNSVTLWMSSEGILQPPFTAPTTDDDLFIEMRKGAEAGKALHVVDMGGEKLVRHYQYMRTLPVVGRILDSIIDAGHPLPAYQIMHQAYFSKGFLLFITYQPIPEAHDLFKRFAAVFDQTYTRFLDLQKAEAQAREAEIQLAMERVRARAMAMHSSQELKEVVHELRKQMGMLGQKSLETCVIHLYDESPEFIEAWVSIDPPESAGETLETTANVPKKGLLIIEEALSAYMANRQEYVIRNEGEKLKQWFAFLEKASPESFTKITEPVQGNMDSLVGFWSFADFTGGSLLMVTRDEPEEATRGLLRRFSQVFGLAYRRFADLKKAEAQTREALIEGALERVRSRSISMRKSEEIADIAAKIFSEMRQLDLHLNRVLIWTFNDTEKYTTWWSSNPEVESTADSYRIDYNDTPVFLDYLAAWQQRTPIYLYTLAGEAKSKFEDHLFEHTEMAKLPMAVKNGMRGETTLYTVSIISDYGIMMSGSLEPLSDQSVDIISRFGRVFQQSYTRYLDVQKAEAQVRESQIQLALERVRARSMAMQHSDELAEVSYLLNKQVVDLGIPTRGCAFNIYNEHDSTEWFSSLEGTLPAYKTPRENIFLKYYEAGQRGETLLIEAFGKERIRQHYEYLFSLGYFGNPEHKDEILANVTPESQIDHAAFFKYGYLLFITLQPAPEAHDIFKRFAKEFEQTYTRFLDLQKAEAQAREAQIEAALEKVRSRTMAMQSSDELSDAAYVLFEQLNILGVTHERINIGIVNEDSQTIDFWVTEQGGDKLSTRFSGRISEPTTLSKAYEAWKKGERSITIDLQGQELANWLKYVVEEIRIPFNNAYLHNRRVQTIGFFSKGMLVVTSPEPLQNEAIYLLEKFAVVFDLTYTRFSDLKLAEAQAAQAEKDLIAIKEAKKKAEEALTELKATQQQLVQSEKMASLGELTAGIAHEIQNPLNFVNNFSEVSHELVSEMKTALAEGDQQTVSDILDDLAANLEKINHHGKRADGIVKGMLQHSRSSSGTKEPTDVNNLCDEFLRLAYHGLRAKDKDFNTKIETAFEQNLPKVSLMSQDVGRVILNLVNNAFYAVNEKKKAESKVPGSTYAPQVTIATKNLGSSIQISVADNGPGIPENIKEKIFQPFFTTKPTGQGTGLGLSLSYDIIKAHGGSLAVQSNERGSEFQISLPLNG